MKSITYQLKQKHELPPNWACYSAEIIGSDWSHINLTGAIARLKTRGKNKGQLTWDRPYQDEREFIYHKDEWDSMMTEEQWTAIEPSIDQFGELVVAAKAEDLALT